MAFKTCITVIAVVYAAQIICGATDEDYAPSTSEGPLSESEYDYHSCIYTILKTSQRNLTLVVNCTMDCGETLQNGMPCVGLDATDRSANGSWSNYRVCVLPRDASEAGCDGRAVIPVLCLGFLHWLG
ncbi:hypothetical protein MRX96_047354 [Rhipicephalus microplus]